MLEASVKAGARGGTVLFGRGAGINEQEKIFGMSIEPEKEIVLTGRQLRIASIRILAEIVRSADLSSTGKGIAFVVPIDKVVGVAHFMSQARPDAPFGRLIAPHFTGHAELPRIDHAP